MPFNYSAQVNNVTAPTACVNDVRIYHFK